MRKRPLSVGYAIFYILFLPDTWQVLTGLLVSYFLTPTIVSPEMGLPAKGILYLMLATIGYAGSRGPARGVARWIKKLVLGDKRPS